jgi:Putative adhesin
MTNWDFPCSDPVDISIDSWASGSIVVAGEATAELTVEVLPTRSGDIADLITQVQVSFEDGQLYVRGPRLGSFRRNKGLDLIIKAPAGSSCAAKTASADLSCVGELSALAMHTASGDITAALVTGDVTVQSASGDVLLNKAGGNLAIRTASGDIQATEVDGDAQFNSASGDVTVGYCSGSVAAHTTSGDIEVGAVAAGRLDLSTTSGDMAVAVLPGIGVYLDLASTSGDIRSDLDPGDDQSGEADAAVEIRCRTLSGDIRIRKARPVRQLADKLAITMPEPGRGDTSTGNSGIVPPRSE